MPLPRRLKLLTDSRHPSFRWACAAATLLGGSLAGE